MTASIPDPVWHAARVQPEAPAIIAAGNIVTYQDLDRRVGATASRLRAYGLSAGDRLAIYQPASVEYLVLLLAAFRSRVVVCPLNTRLPVEAVPEYLSRIDCHTLAASSNPALREVTVLDLDIAPAARADTAPGPWELGIPATLVFTSGSTGTPKAAFHTLGNHIQSARGLASVIALGPGDRWLLDLPLYHVGGLAILFRCMLAGATIVLAEGKTARAISGHRVTHASFVATQLLRLVREEPSTLAGMKSILLGGSAMPPGLVDAAIEAGLPVHTSYGMTEMSSTVTVTPVSSASPALRTSGAVLPGREVGLADDGEVLVRGATLFAGYIVGDEVERPDAGEGWFPTGDLGAWTDVEGQSMLQITGRKDHLFISGGENVQPEEVEAALGGVPGVRRAVVVPVADEEFGHRPVAFVEAQAWTPSAWEDALRRELAAFKVPTAFYVWPEAMDEGMKVKRADFQSLASVLRRET